MENSVYSASIFLNVRAAGSEDSAGLHAQTTFDPLALLTFTPSTTRHLWNGSRILHTALRLRATVLILMERLME